MSDSASTTVNVSGVTNTAGLSSSSNATLAPDAGSIRSSATVVEPVTDNVLAPSAESLSSGSSRNVAVPPVSPDKIVSVRSGTRS